MSASPVTPGSTQRSPECDKQKPDITTADVFAALFNPAPPKGLVNPAKLTDCMFDCGKQTPAQLLHIAELYAEQERHYDFQVRAGADQLRTAQQSHDEALTTKGKAELQESQRRQQNWLLASIKKYAELAEGPEYQQLPQLDQVLFYLSYLLTRADQTTPANSYYQRLLVSHPKSPYVLHAHLSFGDYFFARGELDVALRFYEQILPHRDSPVFGYTLYKKAWVHYRQKDFKTAQVTFIELLDFLSPRTERADAVLAKETKRDLVRTYAKLGATRGPKLLFEKYGKDYAPEMLAQLEVLSHCPLPRPE